MEQKGQNSNDSTNKKDKRMETIRRALPVISIIAGILIIVWWIDSWLVIDSMSFGTCFGVLAPGVVGVFLIISGIATVIRRRIIISGNFVGLFDYAKHNKHIFLRVIFVLLLLWFIVWGIRGRPISSGHLLLQLRLGRRDFGDIKCNGCDLSGANLAEAWMAGAKLREANLSGANIEGAYLHGSNLSGADLRLADLFNAHLNGANLSWADLSGADLRGADLSGADLSWADLSAADLNSAVLNRAHLRGANLALADLSGANLLISELSNVDKLSCATMPDGMTYDGHLNLPGDLDIAKNSRNIDINDDEAMADFYCISLEEYIRGQERNGSD